MNKDNTNRWEERFDKEFSMFGMIFGNTGKQPIEMEYYTYADGTHKVLTTREKLLDFISRILAENTEKIKQRYKIDVMSLGTPTYNEKETKEHFAGRREATDDIRKYLLDQLKQQTK